MISFKELDHPAGGDAASALGSTSRPAAGGSHEGGPLDARAPKERQETGQGGAPLRPARFRRTDLAGTHRTRDGRDWSDHSQRPLQGCLVADGEDGDGLRHQGAQGLVQQVGALGESSSYARMGHTMLHSRAEALLRRVNAMSPSAVKGIEAVETPGCGRRLLMWYALNCRWINFVFLSSKSS